MTAPWNGHSLFLDNLIDATPPLFSAKLQTNFVANIVVNTFVLNPLLDKNTFYQNIGHATLQNFQLKPFKTFSC